MTQLRSRTAAMFGPGLPIPYPALVAAGIRIRPAQTSLTVAAPGAGKSQLWANLAQRMRLPTLYWSADTDQADVTARTLAMWLGLEVRWIEEHLGDEAIREDLFRRLGRRASHIEWVFDPTITGKGLGERLNAFAEIRGRYPALVIVDNLSNAVEDLSDEYVGIKKVMSAGQKLARESKAHFAFLHHAKGNYEDGTKPIPQGGALQNPFKTVELGLTLFRPDDTRMGVVPVKNRGGKSDPGAANPYYLPIDFSRAMVSGYSQGE